MEHDSILDSELIEKINASSDAFWFGVLYDRHEKIVYNKCLSMLKNQTDAEDLTHDIFIKVFISLKQFKGDSQFKTWLYTITYNFCISFLRKKKTQSIDYEENIPDSADDTDIEDQEMFRLKIEQLQWALEEIKPDEKAILLMKYQDDMSLKDIHEALDITESAVKMRLKRAKAKVILLCNNNKIQA